VGLRDRDYMRKKPGDEDWRRYKRETTEAEYGDTITKRRSKLRWIVIGFVLVLILIFIVAIFASHS
jgi:uncharacterized integral membrane protein